MSRIKTIFSNMSWLMVSQVITSVLAFIWTLITARYLGVSDYGIMGTAVSFSSVLVVLSDVGMTTFLVRAVSTNFEIEETYLGNALVVKFFLSVIYLILTIIIIKILGWDNKLALITFLFSIESLLKSFYGLFNTFFQAHEKMKYQAFGNIILNILTFIFIIIITFTNFGLLGITMAYVIANVICLIYTYFALRNHIFSPKLHFNSNIAKMLVISGIPFALTVIFNNIYYSIDMVMLTQIVGPYETGLYNSTYKLLNVLTLFYAIYSSVIFPVMSKLFESDKKLLNLSFSKSIKYLSLITIPLSVATLFYSSDIITLFYGNSYSDASFVLKILIWTVCFLFINGSASILLNSSHKEYAVTKIYAFAAFFNILLNLLLIPRYGVIGAAIATVLSEVMILILELYVLHKINQLPNKHLIFDLIKIIIASSIMGFILYLLNLNMWLAIPVGIIIYFVVIVVIRTVDDDDKVIIKQLIGK